MRHGIHFTGNIVLIEPVVIAVRRPIPYYQRPKHALERRSENICTKADFAIFGVPVECRYRYVNGSIVQRGYAAVRGTPVAEEVISDSDPRELIGIDRRRRIKSVTVHLYVIAEAVRRLTEAIESKRHLFTERRVYV